MTTHQTMAADARSFVDLNVSHLTFAPMWQPCPTREEFFGLKPSGMVHGHLSENSLVVNSCFRRVHRIESNQQQKQQQSRHEASNRPGHTRRTHRLDYNRFIMLYIFQGHMLHHIVIAAQRKRRPERRHGPVSFIACFFVFSLFRIAKQVSRVTSKGSMDLQTTDVFNTSWNKVLRNARCSWGGGLICGLLRRCSSKPRDRTLNL